MKIFTFLVIVTLISTHFVFAQRKGAQFTIYTTIGVKTTLGLSSISNDNIKNDNNLKSKTNSFYFSYGGKFSINYIGIKPINTLLGIHFDYLFSDFTNTYSNLKYDSSGQYNKTLRYKNSNLITVFRYTNLNINMFFEAGTQFTTYRQLKETNSINDSLFYTSGGNYDINNYYKPYTSLVLGIGSHWKRLFFSIRFTKSMKSMMNDKYTPVSDGIYDNIISNINYIKTYVPIKPTNQLTVQLTLEYYFSFISFGRASCGGQGYSFFRDINSEYYWGKKRY